MADNRTYLSQLPQSPVNETSARKRVQMLNSGVIQPGQGDPAFALRMQAALETERQRELALQAQNQQAAQQFRDGFVVNEPVPITKQIPGGDPMSNYLVHLSRMSPQGRKQGMKYASDNMQMMWDKERINNAVMPAEVGSPGMGGRMFDLFQMALGRKPAL
jgi:hypothetical protein